jgi:hypothetical protein
MIHVMYISVSPDYHRYPDVHPIEVLIVGLIVTAWICAMALFLHKWGKLRILQSAEPRYNHNPKNIETIKVVKRPTDSVIYRSYPAQLTKTMDARRKRLERMNTMPNIKVNISCESKPAKGSTHKDINELDQQTEGARLCQVADVNVRDQKHKYKVLTRTITSPVLELDESRASNAWMCGNDAFTIFTANSMTIMHIARLTLS